MESNLSNINNTPLSTNIRFLNEQIKKYILSTIFIFLKKKYGKTNNNKNTSNNKKYNEVNNYSKFQFVKDIKKNEEPKNNSLIQINPIKEETFLQKKHLKSKLHSNWKLYRVISGHNGWVRCVDVDATNNWFATGGNDKVVKFWDLATGTLKLTLTGHINAVRGVVISNRHPYLFSCSEDKQVKCWDLEQNKVVRHYHGHLSGVYSISLHPSLDILVTGGRDSVARVWDMRSRQQIFCLEGHTNCVCSVLTQENDPQIITGSNDSFVKLWDIRNGKCLHTLTHHKKSVRAMVFPENEFTFITGGCDNIKVWKCPEGEFIRNITKSEDNNNTILHALAINSDGVLVSGNEDGTLKFFDYESGYNFQNIHVPVQPGSLDCECGILGIAFDKTSTRMITVGCDKTIKMWKQVDED